MCFFLYLFRIIWQVIHSPAGSIRKFVKFNLPPAYMKLKHNWIFRAPAYHGHRIACHITTISISVLNMKCRTELKADCFFSPTNTALHLLPRVPRGWPEQPDYGQECPWEILSAILFDWLKLQNLHNMYNGKYVWDTQHDGKLKHSRWSCTEHYLYFSHLQY